MKRVSLTASRQDWCAGDSQRRERGGKINLAKGLIAMGELGIQVAVVSKRPQGYFIIHVDGGRDKDRAPRFNGKPIGFK